MRDRTRAKQLATEFLSRGDPTGWFESLYREADDTLANIPWAELSPSPNLLDFWNQHPLDSAGKTALVIGCGLGDDAEQLAAWGFETTAFDIAESAIDRCLRRFPETRVRYQAADLLNPPPAWLNSFDFVFECYTLQALPPSLRSLAMERTAGFLNSHGSLLIIARAREETDPEGQMPWPLTRQELGRFNALGLRTLSFEDYLDGEDPPVRRFRVLLESAID